MRRTWVLFFLSLGLTAVAASSAPTIGVDSETYTATVEPGSMVVHTFELSNSGDQALSITKVRASCGCTATSLEKTELQPGESVGLEVTVNTTGFGGTVQKTVNVDSNDPVTPSLTLRLMLTLVTGAQPEPVPVTPSPTPAAVTPTPPPASDPTVTHSASWVIALAAALGTAAVCALGIVLRRMRRRKVSSSSDS